MNTFHEERRASEQKRNAELLHELNEWNWTKAEWERQDRNREICGWIILAVACAVWAYGFYLLMENL